MLQIYVKDTNKQRPIARVERGKQISINRVRKERINFTFDVSPQQNLKDDEFIRPKDEKVCDYESKDCYEKVEQQYTLIPGRGFV